jgi:hypothetical protein
LLAFLSIQFQIGCSDGECSLAREIIGWMFVPLAVVWGVVCMALINRSDQDN